MPKKRKRKTKQRRSKSKYVWKCDECEWNKRYALGTHTCPRCKSAATLKLQCHSTLISKHLGLSICRWLNDINALFCKKCTQRLNPGVSAKEMEFREELRQRNVFLRACNNFNSNKQNLLLLSYGYINIMVQDNRYLYSNIPVDVIHMCIAFFYDLDKISLINDKFSPAITNNTVLFSDDSRTITYDQQTGTEQHIVGKFKLYDASSKKKIIRYVWKVKILQTDNNKTSCLAISTNDMARRMSLFVQSGDIVSILYIACNHYCAELIFAINNVLFHSKMEGVPIRNISMSRTIMFTISEPMALQMLQIY